MSVINATPLLAAAGGDYQISRSVRLRRSASAYFNRTFGTPTNTNIWTLSGWTKRGLLGTQISLFGASVSSYTSVSFLAGDTLRINLGNGTNGSLVTTQVFRDPSAFYHIAIAYDSTQATASNRIKLYINGVQVTAFSTANYPAQNVSAEWNYSGAVGTIGTAATEYFDGYLTEVNFIDGQALTPSSFGETDSITGVWKPKKYAGTYGTNGFYLNFSDNSSNTATTIGKDNSGNGNNWTPNNISVTSGVTYDSMIDVPTLYADGGNGRGNYCTLNPILQNAWWAAPSRGAISNGNLTLSQNNGSAFSTFDVTTSGKWYAEINIGSYGQSTYASSVVVAARSRSTFEVSYLASGVKNINGGGVTSYGASWTTGDIIGVAIDGAANQVTFYKNGTSQGTLTNTFPNETVLLGYYAESSGTDTVHFNFGQRPFAYTPPTGFKALNTQNLPEPTIKKGNQYFDATTYTATGSTPQTVTNSGSMQPDLVWTKSRSAVFNNVVNDSVRGAQFYLYPNLTNAEVNDSTYLTAFNSNGFSLGTGNFTNGTTMVAWQWKESASAGFDIVTYTGTGANRTVAHSLGVAPKMMVIKRRDSTGSWNVYHISTGNTGAMYLETTNAFASDSTRFNNTSPTSTDFTVGTGAGINASGGTFVAYLFAEVAGFSKAFSYTGNGSADGPFVFCGFRPRWVMIKRTDSTGDWFVFDTARNTFNTMSSFLRPNWSDAEATNTNHSIDLLSNGFKSRAVDTGVNASGGTYIGFAFSEAPFKFSLGR